MTTTLATMIADKLKDYDFEADLAKCRNLSGLCVVIAYDIVGNRLNMSTELMDHVSAKLRFQIMPQWPEFSGEEFYPIRCPNMHLRRALDSTFSGETTAEWAYNNLPRYDGEYGAARLRLKDWLIEYFYEHPYCLSVMEK